MTPTATTMNEYVRNYRLENQYSQTEFAKMIGTTPANLSRIENGHQKKLTSRLIHAFESIMKPRDYDLLVYLNSHRGNSLEGINLEELSGRSGLSLPFSAAFNELDEMLQRIGYVNQPINSDLYRTWQVYRNDSNGRFWLVSFLIGNYGLGFRMDKFCEDIAHIIGLTFFCENVSKLSIMTLSSPDFVKRTFENYHLQELPFDFSIIQCNDTHVICETDLIRHTDGLGVFDLDNPNPTVKEKAQMEFGIWKSLITVPTVNFSTSK